MSDFVKCEGCGRFMGGADFEGGRCHFEPLNEFGPEIVEWTCARCVAADAPKDSRPSQPGAKRNG